MIADTLSVSGYNKLARMEKIYHYVEYYHAKDITLQDAADNPTLNREYFCRMFKKNRERGCFIQPLIAILYSIGKNRCAVQRNGQIFQKCSLLFPNLLMFPNDFFHPNHIIPSPKLISAFVKFANFRIAQMCMEISTISIKIFISFFWIANTGI